MGKAIEPSVLAWQKFLLAGQRLKPIGHAGVRLMNGGRT